MTLHYSASRYMSFLLVGLVATLQVAPAAAGVPGKQISAGELRSLRAQYERPAAVPQPANNPITAQKVALGQMLFFDPRLSGSGQISCGTCHNPGLGWSDGLPRGIGHLGTQLDRHTPTILNVAYGEPYFWDGRAASLEDQAKGPLTSAKEMRMSIETAIPRLQAIPGYVDAFTQAYPNQPISLDTVAAAIATFERTVVSRDAPFDRWVKGDDQAISSDAVRGFVLFNGKANCASCHMGWRMSDDGFHDIGLPGTDRGRAAIMPGIVQLERAFKTPTLRNINQRAPYMHDGSLPTLAAVIDHYDSGFQARSSLDTNMHELNLTRDEKAQLASFLNTLTSPDDPVPLAMLPQ